MLITGTGDADSLAGTAADDTLLGLQGNDLLAGAGGNDQLSGGPGIDTAAYGGVRANYGLERGDDSMVVTAHAGPEGVDTLAGVERLAFANGRVAVDLDGAAGMVVRIVGALLGPHAVHDAKVVGRYLALADAGLNAQELAAAVLGDFSNPFTLTNEAFVDIVYYNVNGAGPPGDLRDLFVGWLDDGVFTQAQLGALAAEQPIVAERIGLQDLVDNGVRYVKQFVPLEAGTSAAESLAGSAANDLMFGRAGDDTLQGNLGNDSLYGGEGDDIAVFAGNFAAYSISTLFAADRSIEVIRVAGPEGVDELRDIEQLQFADQTLRPSWLNILDTIVDSISAQLPNRFANYTISIEPGDNDLIITGPEGTKRLRNVETLTFADHVLRVRHGGEQHDELVASDGAGFLRGHGGDDAVHGSTAADALYGDSGADSLEGGSGDDLLDGGTGADTMMGGVGDDVYIVDSLGDEVVEGGVPLGRMKFDADGPLAASVGAGIDTVLASIDYALGNALENLVLSGTADLSGEGNEQSNVVTGNSGDNVLAGGGGDDVLQGGEGVDTAAYSGARAAYSLQKSEAGFDVTATQGTEGADQLVDIERVRFIDTSVALDLDGAAGEVATLVAALFGSAAVGDQALVGLYLGMLDEGETIEDVAAAAAASDRFAMEAGSHGNADFVTYVYSNVAGFAPDDATRDSYVALLEEGGETQASLAVGAAQFYLTALNIDLVGLAETGLQYQPA